MVVMVTMMDWVWEWKTITARKEGTISRCRYAAHLRCAALLIEREGAISKSDVDAQTWTTARDLIQRARQRRMQPCES